MSSNRGTKRARTARRALDLPSDSTVILVVYDRHGRAGVSTRLPIAEQARLLGLLYAGARRRLLEADGNGETWAELTRPSAASSVRS